MYDLSFAEELKAIVAFLVADSFLALSHKQKSFDPVGI